MNASINSLLGPLEAATRAGSWEDAEDIAGEISRMARLQRLSELQKIQEAISAPSRHLHCRADDCEIPPDNTGLGYMALRVNSGSENVSSPGNPKTPPEGSQVAKTPLPEPSQAPIKQGDSTLIPSALTTPEPSWSEQWPFG